MIICTVNDLCDGIVFSNPYKYVLAAIYSVFHRYESQIEFPDHRVSLFTLYIAILGELGVLIYFIRVYNSNEYIANTL